MRCVGPCGAVILQSQIGYYVGGNLGLPVCKACAEKVQTALPPSPRPAEISVFPGMFVGTFSDALLLELLNSSSGELRSELCGPDDQNNLWEVRRYSNTVTFHTFAYSARRDGARYYTHDRRQGTTLEFPLLFRQKHIQRDRLRWFPWYSTLDGTEPLSLAKGRTTPWGDAILCTPLAGGVYWVTTATHGGFMIALHRAAQLLSQAALAIGQLFGPWLCYEQERACAVVIYEQPDWDHIFDPNAQNLARAILQQYYPQYHLKRLLGKQ
jgi:hypothetical protein